MTPDDATTPAAAPASFDPIDPATLTFHGAGLNRPECVLCTADGDLYTADWHHGRLRHYAELAARRSECRLKGG